ncbi:MAG: hypothetical protein K2N15_05875 [Lachnospiraceae bacterium]|nr:hypothetical protein [Lachnospiraceae bacterium]
MGISVSNTGNVADTKYRMSLSSGGPDWSIIPSSRKSSKSKAEFTDEIKELARKAANTTSKAELEAIHRRRTELCAEYMSDVSPDRKALYQQAKNALKGQGGNPICHGSGELTLLDFLEAAEGRDGKLAEKKFALAGGSTLTCPILTGGGHGADIYYQGTKALTYLGSGYGWACERTPAEREKEREFYGIYFNEYRSLKNSQGTELEELPDYLEEKPSFDMKA